MEAYYGTPLTVELYAELHDIGYKWVTSLERWRLLMRSIGQSGAHWKDSITELQNPRNIKCFKYGPSAREGWIYEVNKVNCERNVTLDYTKLHHLSWSDKMRLEFNLPNKSLSNEETLVIVDKWSGIQAGIVMW